MNHARKLSMVFLHFAFLISLMPTRALADTSQELMERINRAVCLNNWDTAITETTQLIGNSDISPTYRDTLVAYRQRYQQYRAAQTEIDMSSNSACDGIEIAQQEETPAQPAQPLDWESAIASIQSSTSVQSGSVAREPQYFGTSCNSFSTQQEAQFHFMNGSAPPSLDGEGDGIACEFLPTTPRQDGSVSRIISASGLGVQIIRASSSNYYLRLSGVEINGVELAPFSTRSFSSGTAARNHYYRYYSGRG